MYLCIFCLNEQNVLGAEMCCAKEYYNLKKKKLQYDPGIGAGTGWLIKINHDVE